MRPLEADDLFVRTNARTLRDPMLGNVLDWCGVSIPTGFDAAGLPTPSLFSGGPGADDAPLASALAADGHIRLSPPEAGDLPH